jgi:hypothetical protein
MRIFVSAVGMVRIVMICFVLGIVLGVYFGVAGTSDASVPSAPSVPSVPSVDRSVDGGVPVNVAR